MLASNVIDEVTSFYHFLVKRSNGATSYDISRYYLTIGRYILVHYAGPDSYGSITFYVDSISKLLNIQEFKDFKYCKKIIIYTCSIITRFLRFITIRLGLSLLRIELDSFTTNSNDTSTFYIDQKIPNGFFSPLFPNYR